MTTIKKVVSLEIEDITKIITYKREKSLGFSIKHVKIKVIGNISYREIVNGLSFCNLYYVNFSEDFYITNSHTNNNDIYNLATDKICKYLRTNELELYLSAISEGVIENVTLDFTKIKVVSYNIKSTDQSDILKVDLVGKVHFLYDNKITVTTIYRSFDMKKSFISDIDKICKKELTEYLKNTYAKGNI